MPDIKMKSAAKERLDTLKQIMLQLILGRKYGAIG
jgi:hypothetical protein